VFIRRSRARSRAVRERPGAWMAEQSGPSSRAPGQVGAGPTRRGLTRSAAFLVLGSPYWDPLRTRGHPVGAISERGTSLVAAHGRAPRSSPSLYPEPRQCSTTSARVTACPPAHQQRAGSYRVRPSANDLRSRSSACDVFSEWRCWRFPRMTRELSPGSRRALPTPRGCVAGSCTESPGTA